MREEFVALGALLQLIAAINEKYEQLPATPPDSVVDLAKRGPPPTAPAMAFWNAFQNLRPAPATS